LQTFSKVGDNGLIPNPGYPLFEYLFKLNKIESVFYYLEFNKNWQFNIHEIRESLTPHIRFLILIIPNNPTGTTIPQQDLNEIINLCQLKKIFLIIDEVFIPFSDYQYSLPPKNNITTPIFILNGISKMFGLPDFKLGWILVYGKSSEFYVDKLGTTNDVYLSTTTLTQKLLPDLFKNIKSIQQPIIDRLKINREFINDFFIKNTIIFFCLINA
jgi:alanine-synthesizing transaminase